MTRPPRRWLDDPHAPEGARALLASLRAPDPATHDRVRAALVASGALPMPPPAAPPAAPTPPSASPLAPVHTVGTLSLKHLGAIVVISLAARRDQSIAPRPITHSTVVASALTVAHSHPRARPSPPVGIPATVPTVVDVTPAPVVPVPPRVAPHVPSLVRARVITQPDPVAVVPADTGLDAERMLLQSMYAALASDPARALQLADEHTRRFPSGVLGHEREVLAVEALARLGRTAEALDRADSFLREHPNSTQAPRVRALRARVAEGTP